MRAGHRVRDRTGGAPPGGPGTPSDGDRLGAGVRPQARVAGARARARRVDGHGGAGFARPRRARARGLRGRLPAAAAPPSSAHGGLRGQRRGRTGGRVMAATLRVCSLYPDLMNIYADRGNIAVLRARCAWRGLGFELASVGVGEPVDPNAHDLFYMGGGQDRDQIAVAEDMVATKRDSLHAAADRGAVVLAVCGGYQPLGSSYQLGDDELPGVGLVDLRTIREPGPRLIGNCAIEADLGTGPRTIAGVEK